MPYVGDSNNLRQVQLLQHQGTRSPCHRYRTLRLVHDHHSFRLSVASPSLHLPLFLRSYTVFSGLELYLS